MLRSLSINVCAHAYLRLQTYTDRQTNTQTDRQTDRDRDRDRDRQTDRQSPQRLQNPCEELLSHDDGRWAHLFLQSRRTIAALSPRASCFRGQGRATAGAGRAHLPKTGRALGFAMLLGLGAGFGLEFWVEGFSGCKVSRLPGSGMV